MSRDERAGEDRRPFAARDASAPSERAERQPRRADGAAGPRKHAQMVFITPMGVPIGPSIQEELNIPDDLDDTLPPGDFPGQLLLDLGLG